MRRWVILIATHLAMLAMGFAGGVYTLPILTAPQAPDAAALRTISAETLYAGRLARDLKGSDLLHWGEGEIRVSRDRIAHIGRLAPGPDYKLYLAPRFVDTKEAFLLIKDRRTQLALAPPLHSPTARPEVVLVWGGSSSVGCNAIQLAVASGYRCVATASARNAGLLKELGASEVLDHSSPAIVEDVIEAMRGRSLAGTLHATGHMKDCFAVIARCEGSRRVAATLAPPDERPFGVEATHISGTSLKDDEVGPMIYREFLPQALAARTFVPAPPAKVVGEGLEMLQAALEALKAGVSAAKIVVTLP